MLLDHRANPDIATKSGATPLHLASMEGHTGERPLRPAVGDRRWQEGDQFACHGSVACALSPTSAIPAVALCRRHKIAALQGSKHKAPSQARSTLWQDRPGLGKGPTDENRT